MATEFNHMELRSKNVKKATKFYASLFGWKLQPMPEMNYTMFSIPRSKMGGGMMQAEPKGTPHWVPYVRVTNINAAVKKAKALGAKVTMGPMQIPGYGKIAVLHDPSGSPIGLSQPKS